MGGGGRLVKFTPIDWEGGWTPEPACILVFWESTQYRNSAGQRFVDQQTGIQELQFMNI
jgi:hypothetical protein